MTEEEFRTEIERIIQSSPPHMHLKMRALQAKCDGIRRKSHWTQQQKLDAIFSLMMDSFAELREALNSLNRED